MAVSRIWNIDWLNANRQRSYPLTEDSTMRDSTGSIVLPDDFIVDLALSVPHIQQGIAGASRFISPGEFHLLYLAVFSQGIVVTFGYNNAPCGVATVTVDGFVRDSAYPIGGQGDFYDARGAIVVGDISTLMSTVPLGVYTFTASCARLEPCTVRPSIRGVSSLSVVNGRDVSAPMTGDVNLVAGRNIRFVVTAPNTVRIDSVASPALLSTCSCDTLPADAQPILTINGIPPDASRNFTLLPSACMDISPEGEATLKLSDTCSTPCCGCEELEVLKSDLTLLQQQANSITSVVASFESQLAQLRTAVLGSRLALGTNWS